MRTAHIPNRTAQLERNGLGSQTHSGSMVREDWKGFTPFVSIEGCEYLVDFGSDSEPRFHRVNKNKQCSCGAADCEAIDAVRFYLQVGGARAPDPEGMPPCPICGNKTYRDRNWDGKYTKELGWRCTKGGLRHFLEAKAERIKRTLQKIPGSYLPHLDTLVSGEMN